LCNEICQKTKLKVSYRFCITLRLKQTKDVKRLLQQTMTDFQAVDLDAVLDQFEFHEEEKEEEQKKKQSFDQLSSAKTSQVTNDVRECSSNVHPDSSNELISSEQVIFISFQMIVYFAENALYMVHKEFCLTLKSLSLPLSHFTCSI